MGDTAVIPWDYYAGHLLKTVGEVVIESFGAKGEEMIRAAMATFADHFGPVVAEIVASYRETDFDRLPDPCQALLWNAGYCVISFGNPISIPSW